VDGKVLEKWGGTHLSNNKGEFNSPRAITIDNNYAYICDSLNDRLQLLTKEKGTYVTEWGNGLLSFPTSIYYYKDDSLFYIGDRRSVQLYTREGTRVQRLGEGDFGFGMHEFNLVYGIAIMEDKLFISDSSNKRVQIFKRDLMPMIN